MEDKLIITIGREFGSGGHETGDLLAKRLRIKCYDKELLVKTAEDSGLSEQYISENEEKKPGIFSGVIAGGLNVTAAGTIIPPSEKLFIEQFNTINKIAEKESCVFVGRCADYVLSKHTNLINVFITAPLETRIKRIMARQKIDEAAAKTLIRKTDRDRERYYEYFTGRTWGNAANYDLCINTAVIGTDGAVQVILEYLTAKM